VRLLTFVPPDGQARAGALLGQHIIDLAAAAPLVLAEAEGLRWDMRSLLRGDQDDVNLEGAADIVAAVVDMLGDGEAYEMDGTHGDGNGARNQGTTGNLLLGGVEMLLPLEQVRLLAPLPRPASLRCFEAFEEHIAAVFRQSAQALPAAWYRFPAFAFGNHGAILGPDAPLALPDGSALDYELELGCIIGREGRDIAPEAAADYIAGYTIVNDWSDRELQAEAGPLGLGAARARAFATSLGPWLVTPDELDMYNDDGRLLLTMQARVNHIERSRGNFTAAHYSVAEMIAAASRAATLYPGDVLCSGAVGGGSLLEQTGGYGPWLEPGDVVELEITGLGILRNQIV
jgi:fumarylacetoacetate (FAA) hydrolase